MTPLARIRRALQVSLGVCLLCGAGLGLLDGALAELAALRSVLVPAERIGLLLLLWLLPLLPAVLLGFLQAAAALLLDAFGRRLSRSTSPTRTVPWIARLCTLLVLPAVVYVCAQIFSGPRAQRVPGHDLLAIAIGVLGSGLFYQGVCLAFRGVDWVRQGGRERRRRGSLLAALLAAGALSACLADRLLLPRLYSWFHLSLLAIAVGLGQLAALYFALGSTWLRRRWLHDGFLAAAAALLAVIAGAGALLRLERAATLRAAALEHATLGARLLHLQAALRHRQGALGLNGGGIDGDGDGGDDAEDAAAEPVLPGPGPQLSQMSGADIFLVTVDALRADRLAPRTMPNAWALGQDGVVFERAYTQVPHTSFAVATLLTGKPVYALSAMGKDAGEHETLPLYLRRARYKTAAFFPPSVFFIEHDRLKKLEESAYGFEYVKYEYLPAERRTQQVIDFLEQERPERAFVWVHYLEPHEPYDVHPGGPGRRAPDRDRYDGEVRFADQQIGRLAGYLRGRRRGTLLVIAADHGEEFGEHGGRYHGTTLYDEQVRVPLLFSGLALPAPLPPHRVREPVGLIDVAPTILGLLGIPPSARMRGHDLGPWLNHPGAPVPRWPVFGEIGRKKMVVLGESKLICDLGTDSCALYDTGSDPQERRNLVDREPRRAQALRRRLRQYLEAASRFERPERPRPDAAAPGEPAEQLLRRGRLGDLTAAPGLARLVLGPAAPPAARAEAAALLSELCLSGPQAMDDTVRAALLAAGAFDDERTRRWAAAGRLALGDAGALERVLEAARDEKEEPRLRLLAALALDRAHADPAQTAGPDLLPLLAAVLPAALALDDPERARPLIQALGRTRDPRALPTLLSQLENVRSRLDLVRALGELGQPQAVPELSRLLRSDPYVPVRAAAATALGRLGGREAQAALRRAQGKEREAPVRDAIRAAVEGR